VCRQRGARRLPVDGRPFALCEGAQARRRLRPKQLFRVGSIGRTESPLPPRGKLVSQLLERERGQFENSIAATRRSVADMPTLTVFQSMLANLCAWSGDHDEARSILESFAQPRAPRRDGSEPDEASSVETPARVPRLAWHHFFNDLIHAVGTRGVDVRSHPLEARSLALLHLRLTPQLA
jgi:hypothetical protein